MKLLDRSGYKQDEFSRDGSGAATIVALADQGPYAFACGFDEIELPAASVARQTEAQWKKALAAITVGYQPGYARPQSILERRLAARHGA